jgi:uncharacterized protein YjeT (DUF2065 family)
MLSGLVAAFGLVLVIEGLLYAVVPGQMKRLMMQALAASDDSLRLAGVAAMAAGVGLVWLMHSG